MLPHWVQTVNPSHHLCNKAYSRHNCGAAFLWVALNCPSCRPRRGLQGADGGEDLAKDVARYSHLCQLERDFARMTYDPCPNLYGAALYTCQRPVCNLFGQFGTL